MTSIMLVAAVVVVLGACVWAWKRYATPRIMKLQEEDEEEDRKHGW